MKNNARIVTLLVLLMLLLAFPTPQKPGEQGTAQKPSVFHIAPAPHSPPVPLPAQRLAPLGPEESRELFKSNFEEYLRFKRAAARGKIDALAPAQKDAANERVKARLEEYLRRSEER